MIAEALNRLDYFSLAQQELPDNSAVVDFYIKERARLILGLRTEGDQSGFDVLSGQPGLLSMLTFFDSTTRGPVSAYQLREFEAQSLEENAPFLRAEKSFLCGYGYICRNDFQSSIGYSQVAVDYYIEAHLYGPASIALLNLCVAYNHLNYRDLFDATLTRLKKLLEEHPEVPKLTLVQLQMYQHIDVENYQQAYDNCLELLAIDRRLHRLRDQTIVTLFKVYLSAKLNLPTTDLDSSAPCDGYHSTWNAYREVIGSGFLCASPPIEASRAWQAADVDPVHHILLLELICEQYVRLGDFETLLCLARHAKKFSAQSQQNFNLVDFRYYEGSSLVELGEVEQGRRVLNSCGRQAKQSGARARSEKIERVLQSISSRPATEELASKPAPFELTLDWQGRSLSFIGGTIDLWRKPIIFSLLHRLFCSSESIPIPDLYEQVYERPYNPTLHFERMNSLINRTRKILQVEQVIIRTDKRIQINPKYQVRVLNEPGNEKSFDQRRKRILEVLRNHPGGAALSDIASQFSCSLRTLQNDLTSLVEQGLVDSFGKTKARVYRVPHLEDIEA